MPGWNEILNVQNRIGDYQTKTKKKKRTTKASQNLGVDFLDMVINRGAGGTNPITVQAGYRGYPSSSTTNWYAADQAAANAATPTPSSTLANAYRALTDTGKGPGSTNPGQYGGADGRNYSGEDVLGETPFNEWSGNAADYVGAGRDILFDEPRILVRDMLKKLGFNPDDGLIDLLSRDANNLEALLMLGSGAQPGSLESMTDEQFINFAGDWAKMMTTPGAGTPDAMAMIQNILDAPAGSALAELLSAGTPQEQAAWLNKMVEVAGGSLTPLAQRALMASLEGRTDDWLSSKAKGGKDPLANYLQKGGRGIMG